MNTLIIYCHPSSDSFTFLAKEALVKGLTDSGHYCEISDLYAMNFNPVMNPSEYVREAFLQGQPSYPCGRINGTGKDRKSR